MADRKRQPDGTRGRHPQLIGGVVGRVPDAARQACLSSRVSLALCSGHAAIEVIVPLWHERHTEEVIGAGGSRVDYRSAAGLTAVSAVASLLVPGERFELPTNG